jgi:quercetin dioxygenase-like cupin family protein
MSQTIATIQRKIGDHSMEALHESERQWETLRFPGQWSKMLFHPWLERPTEPNAGLVGYEPGAHHPVHRPDFAQILYILDGTFTIGGKIYDPGTTIYHADPH